MAQLKNTINIRGKEIGNKQPLICTPLIGGNMDAIAEELKKIVSKKPDLIEWRADFFESLNNIDKVLETAAKIREQIGETPLLFTIRSHKEGGQPIPLSEQEKLNLLSELCRNKAIDLVDYELVNDHQDIQLVREVSREHGIALVLSYHNFDCTPPSPSIVDKILEAEKMQADIAKVAVMPKSKMDALLLLAASEEAQKELKIPLISISMGEYGAISRLLGYYFGSDITFAIGEASSAPGQIPIEDLRAALSMIKKYV
ncbi:type I 3-dehydroquinate dehydratase [Ammoniphilus sp. 3BR4]|uniref:type I 3-dehydroquinate dehydratase n=1 Tax=Ammoniphilus sp. 3BR4 TaxID=3158265 RepID=UPI003466A310